MNDVGLKCAYAIAIRPRKVTQALRLFGIGNVQFPDARYGQGAFASWLLSASSTNPAKQETD